MSLEDDLTKINILREEDKARLKADNAKTNEELNNLKHKVIPQMQTEIGELNRRLYRLEQFGPMDTEVPFIVTSKVKE